MSLHLVIGYAERSPKSEPVLVYMGRDRSACNTALDAARNDPQFAEFHIINNPGCYRKGSNVERPKPEAVAIESLPVPVEEPSPKKKR